MLESGVERRRLRYRVNPYLENRGSKGRFTVDTEQFDGLFEILKHYLEPKTQLRPNDKISPKEKLAIVLEYLDDKIGYLPLFAGFYLTKINLLFADILHPDQYKDRLHQYTALDEIPELTSESFVTIANKFNATWNFPNCLGAFDGKHVALKCPNNSGLFYNYKPFHSIVLMAVADSNYKSIYLDVGAHGSEGDVGLFGVSKFGQSVLADEMPFSENCEKKN